MADDIEQPAIYTRQRQIMVDRQIAARGIRSPLVLKAMNKVPREAFLSPAMREFAYEDAPLPIAGNQTISQPYIVAYMVDALELKGGERVLEVGTGSGYAAAILSEIAERVYTLERLESLANGARDLLRTLDCRNVRVIHGDGTLGWQKAAPYQAIVVAAGGPSVPEKLKEQLAIGGRLVIPVGTSESYQALLRVTRTGKHQYTEEHLTNVRFVPLVGDEGWPDSADTESVGNTSSVQSLVRRISNALTKPTTKSTTNNKPQLKRNSIKSSTSEFIADAAEPVMENPERTELDKLMSRIGNSRVVLIGEASHGTSEFYRFRARITQELIRQKDFSFVAVEADWPDASHIDHYVRDRQTPASEWTAFTRFPTWMWRNEEVREFVDWLREHNAAIVDPRKRVGFYGLDLYSLFTSIDAILGYLDGIDQDTARIARERYGCLTPWQADPATYGRAAISGRYRECEDEVVAMLSDLLSKRLQYTPHGDERYMDAVQNARVIANAERYYRSLYGGYGESWNLRDSHMFDTLQSLLAYGGHTSKAVIWEHNSHIGDASGTDMVARGQYNLGQLCREAYGEDAYLIGFGTHSGTVAAATNWGDPVEIKRVLPSLKGSWERLCHDTEIPAFTLGLRKPASTALSLRLHENQLERAIGVIYRPETERASHYFEARLADQFDEYVWFDETHALTPLNTRTLPGMPDTYPFGI